jgi:NADH:ubiquinone oxidoreductase subunit 4 (subunit M)
MTVMTKLKGFAAAASLGATLLAGGANFAAAEEVVLTMAVLLPTLMVFVQFSPGAALLMLGVLAIAVIWMGIYPAPFTDAMQTSVSDLLNHVANSKLPQ